MPGLSAPQAVAAAMFSASTLKFTFERQPVWMDGSLGSCYKGTLQVTVAVVALNPNPKS